MLTRPFEVVYGEMKTRPETSRVVLLLIRLDFDSVRPASAAVLVSLTDAG